MAGPCAVLVVLALVAALPPPCAQPLVGGAAGGAAMAVAAAGVEGALAPGRAHSEAAGATNAARPACGGA